MEFVTGNKRPSRRSRLIQYWQTLRPDTPMIVTPIPVNHQGSTKDDDGIRITGSPQFISAAISRLKEILAYENEQSKIEIIYKKTESQDGPMARPSYVMYIQVRERSHGKASKAPKLPELPKPPSPPKLTI